MLKIFCKNTGTFQEFQEGTTLLEMLPAFEFDRPYDILSAKVNNVSEGLKFRVFNNRDVEFLDFRSYSGRNVYCRSLSFLLCKAARDLFPDYKIVLRRPISKGYYCNVDKPDGSEVTPEETAQIREHMQELVAKDIPFRRHEVQTSEAIRIFKKLGYEDKVKLLRTCGDVYITYYTLQDTADYYYDALVPSTGLLKVWDLLPYRGGMLLRVPDRHAPGQLAPFFEQPKTFGIFTEMLRWNRIMGLGNVGDVNCACLSGKASDMIQISEALQEKKIVQIAEEIERRHQGENPVRIVLITGPTSSGKSTFCKRLSIQLMACGLHPVSFSTDDYFVNRLDTPKFPDGSYDFDNFETVDHDYLQEDVLQLLAGEEVEVPEYNFVTGKREFNGKKLQLDERSVLLVEGIHALNPLLTNLVPESAKFRIFINTVTSISPVAPHRSRLQQGRLHGARDHLQLAQRPPGGGQVDLPLSRDGRRHLQLRLPGRVRRAAHPCGAHPGHRAEELRGIRRGAPPVDVPALFRARIRQGTSPYLPHPELYRLIRHGNRNRPCGARRTRPEDFRGRLQLLPGRPAGLCRRPGTGRRRQ